MENKRQRGLNNRGFSTRADTRSGWEKFKDNFSNTKAATIPISAAAISLIPSMQPHAAAIFACSLPIAGLIMSKKVKVPLELPFYANRNSNKYSGFFFFGNEMGTNKELWLTDSEARRHILIFGTTGSGKTEALIGLIGNSLAQNSAFTYVDGKSDTGLFAKVFSMCRRFGREDDLLVINYMVGTLRADLKRDKKLSNTLNPFATATAEALSELLTTLLPSGGSSDGIWKDRASSYISALVKALVSLRDQGKLLLDVSVIRSYFQLEKTIELSKKTDIDPDHLAGLVAYVCNLPGYKEGSSTIESTVYEQHGFITMQFSPCFGMLSDTYSHIMRTQLADCSFEDIVLQRRALVVLLPALEKSPANLGNLGKIVISSIKGMMAGALGAELEGKTEFILDSKPTNGRTYQCVFDEWGYYSVEGASVMPAQARGIGFSLIFAGQDYQAFKKGSEIEAASIRSNAATKICMCLEDPTETADIFVDGAGEDYDQTETGLEREAGAFGSRYIKKKDITYEKTKRVNPLDLKDQLSGEYHLINMATLIRGRSFYANPPKPRELRVNTFVKVKPPSFQEISTTTKSLHELKKQLKEVRKSKKKLSSLWNSHVDEDNKELSKNLTFLVGKENLTQATFSLALRKNAIDLIDQKMVIKLKELESVINRELNSSEIFNDGSTFENVTSEQLDESTKRLSINENPKEKLLRLVKENEKIIIDEVDLDNNPLGSFDVELDYANETITNLSNDIIKRWKSKGILTEDAFVLIPDMQADLAYAASQELILSGNNFKKVYETEQDEIDQFDFDELTKNK